MLIGGPARVARRFDFAPLGEFVRYPMDHFGCFWPEHINRVVDDELDFLRRHLFGSKAAPESTAAG